MSTTAGFARSLESHERERCQDPVIDSHLHGVDFLQESDGLVSLLDRMDAANISHAVIFGLPVIKKWGSEEPDRPNYYLDDDARCYYYTGTDEILAGYFQALSPVAGKRLAPMLCGFNHTDRNAVFQVERKLASSGMWKGIGELICRHDDLTSQTLDETSRMNHPALLPIYDLAGTRGLPVLIHQNSTSVGVHDRFEYLEEVREPLSGFPGTTFVWAHCGISRRVVHKYYHVMLEEMLQDHPNLNVDLSWVVYDQTVCRGGVPKKAWLSLIEKYPERFLIGSDICGRFHLVGKCMARYDRLLDMLSAGTRQSVSSLNARRIWNF